MPTITQTEIVHYSTQQMYTLVNDVKAYPQFLPYCIRAAELERHANYMVASMTLGWLGIEYTFTTRNTLTPYHEIGMVLVDGPFKHLVGSWQFEPAAAGSKVRLTLDFEFSSYLVELAFGPVFRQVSTTLINAFDKRAEALYG